MKRTIKRVILIMCRAGDKFGWMVMSMLWLMFDFLPALNEWASDEDAKFFVFMRERYREQMSYFV